MGKFTVLHLKNGYILHLQNRETILSVKTSHNSQLLLQHWATKPLAVGYYYCRCGVLLCVALSELSSDVVWAVWFASVLFCFFLLMRVDYWLCCVVLLALFFISSETKT